MTAPEAGVTILVLAALTTALFHTLIPDHWLPFVLIGLARGWSGAQAACWSGLSAVIHIVFSLVLGLAGLGVGHSVARALGEAFGSVSGTLLIAFGLTYAFWARRKGGHFHIGGRRAHRHERLGRPGPPPPAAPAAGGSPLRPGSMEEVDEDLIRPPEREGRGPLYLAAIIGLNPCVLVLPLLMKGGELGAGAVLATSLAYAASTLVMMTGLTFLAVAGGRRLEMPWLHRHAEFLSGMGIAVVGVVFLLIE